MNKYIAAASGVVLLGALGLAAGSALAADVDSSCAGKKFVFFPGGAQGDTFASIVYRGALLAQKQTGCDVEYVWSDWNPEKMVSQFKEAIARKPTGIAIMGHPGESALGSLVDEARSQGIFVTTQNVELPNIEKKYAPEGLGYVGPLGYEAGVSLGNAAVDACGLKDGDSAMVWGLLAQAGRGERTKGVVDALKKRGIKVDYLESSDAVNKDPSQGASVFSAAYAKNPEMKMLITDHGSLTATIPVYFRNAGVNKDQVCGAGFDLSGPTAAAIKSGDVRIILDQQPFLQGYIPVLQLYLSSKFGFAGMHIDSGAAMITKANIDTVAPLAEQGVR